jgi:hypothetical protein
MLIFASKLLLDHFDYWKNNDGTRMTVFSQVLLLLFVLRFNSAGYLRQHLYCLRSVPDPMSIRRTSLPFFVYFILAPILV